MCSSLGKTELYLVLNDLGKDDYEIVTPSWSILPEPPVAVVKNTPINPVLLSWLKLI